MGIYIVPMGLLYKKVGVGIYKITMWFLYKKVGMGFGNLYSTYGIIVLGISKDNTDFCVSLHIIQYLIYIIIIAIGNIKKYIDY